MSYDLAVWDGPLPSTRDEALATYQSLYDRYVEGGSTPPTAPIKRYVDALLQRWPDIDTREDSPWSDGPLIDNASGPFVYFGMQHSRADEASSYAAALAREHGLVCFDPQRERLRP